MTSTVHPSAPEPLSARRNSAGFDRLHVRDFRQRPAAVLGAAAVHQDGAAAARRFARGVVGGDGVFPVAAARGLRLRTSSHAAIRNRMIPVVVHLGLLVVAFALAAAVDRKRLGQPAVERLRDLAARAVYGLDRPAVFSRWPPTIRCCRPGSCTPDILMGRIPISCMRRPTSAVSWRCCPIRFAAGADVHPAHPEPDVDRWLWPADPADCRLRLSALALARGCGER